MFSKWPCLKGFWKMWGSNSGGSEGSICWDITIDSCWFLAWINFQPWELRRYIPSKHRVTFNGVHGLIFQKTEFFSVTACLFFIRKFSEPSPFVLCCQTLECRGSEGATRARTFFLSASFAIRFKDAEKTWETVLHIYVDKQHCSGCLQTATADSISAPDIVFSLHYLVAE
jgi:hypothetical protein